MPFDVTNHCGPVGRSATALATALALRHRLRLARHLVAAHLAVGLARASPRNLVELRHHTGRIVPCLVHHSADVVIQFHPNSHHLYRLL